MRTSISNKDIMLAQKNIEVLMNAKDVVTIGTHDGQFHADEIFALAIMEMAYPRLNYRLVRTRDEERLKECDILLDVGATYDIGQLKLDHHMTEGVPTYTVWYDGNEELAKMATAGISLQLFGDKIMSPKVKEAMTNWFFQIDVTDNGDIKYLGESKATTMMAVISMYNDEDVNSSRQDTCFYDAMILAKELISKKIKILNAKIKFEDTVIEAAKSAKDGIMVLEIGGPWVDPVLENPELFKDIKLCVFEAKIGDHRIQTLPGSTRFEMRCPAPQAWRGLRNEDLVVECGIHDAKFVHPAGFIGGTTSQMTALAMAKTWIELSE